MRVLLVGDLHGNGAWLEQRVFVAAVDVAADLILQVGDFGWWPGAVTNNAFLSLARSAAPVPFLWIDGNHEDHARLASAVRVAGGPDRDGTVSLGGMLSFVPRGCRFDWDGVTVLACGGAHSIDRRLRTDGVTWFEAEHVTDDDVDRCRAAGSVDVLVTHDAPSGWPIPDLPSDRSLPRAWQPELPACHAHRDRLARVAAAARPTLIVHGHYHVAYRRAVQAAWGPLQAVGLGDDGDDGNLALLSCEQGEWTVEAVGP